MRATLISITNRQMHDFLDSRCLFVGSGIFGLGLAAAAIRKASVYANIKHSRDKSYGWLLQWITANARNTQHRSVATVFENQETRKISTHFNFMPSVGQHFFSYRGHLIRVDQSRKQAMNLHTVMFSSMDVFKQTPVQIPAGQKMVVISDSRNIYENLALEDWLYSNCRFSPSATLLLIWRDDACVVIGRHQNPWTEVNLQNCQKNGLRVARRHSGGGTVYHDMGNINFSFVTRRQDYDRKKNLQMISTFLGHEFGVESEISKRDDLLVTKNGAKISGSASKLGRENAYHHFTLLVDVDMDKMRQAIRKDSPAVLMSRATTSFRSKTTNLKDLVPDLETDTVIKAAAHSFSPHILYVSPGEQSFPPLNERMDLLSSWDWIFGKTPRFTAKVDYDDSLDPISLSVTVKDGKIEAYDIEANGIKIENLFLENCLFTREAVSEKLIEWALVESDCLLTCNICKAADILFDRIT